MITKILIKDILRITFADIAQYGKEYIDNGLYLGIALAILYSFISLLGMKKHILHIISKAVIIILSAVYGYAVAGITILSRNQGSTQVLDLQLFHTFSGELSDMVFIVENIIMFIPLGVLLPLLWKEMRRFYLCIPVGFIGSLLIESIQYRLQCGKFQVDDLLNNVIGTILGFYIYQILAIIINKLSVENNS